MVENQKVRWRPYQQQFLGQNLERICQRANELMMALHGLPEYESKHRKGGVIVLADESVSTYSSACIAEVPGENPHKYLTFALKKCQALRDNVKIPISFIVRNEVLEVFGGGLQIRCKWDSNGNLQPAFAVSSASLTGRAYVAFSGLPELADEALVLVLAIDMYWITQKDAEKFAALSKNPYFHPLYAATRKSSTAETK